MLCTRVPYPLIGGDKLKNFNIIKILSGYFDIHLIIITDEPYNHEYALKIRPYVSKLSIFSKPKIFFYFNALKALINKKPIQVNYYYFPDIQNYINEALADADAGLAILIRSAQYLLLSPKTKFLDMVDSIALNYQHSHKKVSSLFWKLIYLFEARRLHTYEKRCMHSFDKTVLTNKQEVEYWNKYGDVEWIPHGVSKELLEYNAKDEKYRNYVAFFGKMNYQPNIDAVLWFYRYVIPHLNPKIKFIVVGAYPTHKVMKIQSDRERLLGIWKTPIVY